MKTFVFLVVALVGILLVREQGNGTFATLDNRIFEMLALHYLPQSPIVTMVRHNEQSADISGSSQLTEMDMALFLRTALKFSASSIGIAGDMAAKSGNPLAGDILSIQTHRNANVYFGLEFSPDEKNPIPYFKPSGRVSASENVPFHFSGLPLPPELPKTATIGFLNVDEKAAQKNLIPVIALYRDIPIPSFALVGLLASNTIAQPTIVSPGMEFPISNGNRVRIDSAGFFRVQESADVLIERVTLDELLLEMEKFESGKKSEKLQTLLSGRSILLGRDGEADRTITLASRKKYSALHVQALTMASFIAGRIVTPVSPYWSLLMLVPIGIFLPFTKSAESLTRWLMALFLLVLPIGLTIGMHTFGIWLSPIPAIGMAVSFIIAAFFLTARIRAPQTESK